MKVLHELLRDYVEKSNYTVYSLSYASKVNRTTLQRALTGERPISRENLNKLLPFLNLTLNEKTELEKAFLISQMGEFTYQKHLYIQNLLENLELSNKLSEEDTVPFFSSGLHENQRFINGTFKIIRFLYQIISYNVQNEEKPFLYILSHFQNQFFKDLYELLQAPSFRNLEIRQIVPFVKCTQAESSASLFNLQILSTLLPLALSSQMNCTFNYYYEETNFFSLSGIPFTYYLLSNHHIVMLTADCEDALLLPETFMNFYMQHFKKLQAQTFPLLDTLDSSALLSSFTVSTFLASCSYAIEAQPNILYCIDATMLSNILNRDLPKDRKKFLSDMLTKQSKNLHRLTKAVSVFTKKGYLDFVEKGVIYQIPDSFGHPFNIEERITILERLIRLNSYESHSFYLLKETAFYPKIEFFSYDSSSVIFYFRSGENEFRTCTLKEPYIIDSLNHFICSLPIYQLVYTKEETTEFFRKSLVELKNSK